MFMIAYISFGFGSFLSLETIKSNIIHENTINAHLSGFKLMPYSLHFWKHNLSFYKWLSMPLHILIKLSKYFMNVLVTTFWYIGGPFLTPNNITFHIKAPQYITNVLLYLFSITIEIWWHPNINLRKNMHHTLLLCLAFHLWKVMGMDLSLWLHLVFWNAYRFSICHFSWVLLLWVITM